MHSTLHSSPLDQVTALIDGLERLEKQYGVRGVLHRHAMVEQQLILTLALLRNTIAPTLLGILPPPVHVAVVGGTNCGKSTVTNVLVGEAVAQASLQGGFTRIPTGYAIQDVLSGAWHEQPLVLKGLRAQGKVGGCRGTEQEYALVPLYSPAPIDYLQQAVIWDTPDVDSRYARERQHRVLEIIGLADMVVLVLSKEKYADHTAYELLSLLLMSGKPVVVCLNKFTSGEFAEGLAHFRRQMLDTPDRQQAVGEPVMLAYVDPTMLDRVWATSGGVSAQVQQAIAARLRQPQSLRQQSARGAVRFVADHVDALLQPAWRECALRAEWRVRVEEGLAACLAFYRQHYLEDERRYDSFRLALLRLIELLDIPGINRLTRLLRQVITAPVRWGWGLLKRLVVAESPALEQVLPSLRQTWELCLGDATDMLQASVHETVHGTLSRLQMEVVLEQHRQFRGLLGGYFSLVDLLRFAPTLLLQRLRQEPDGQSYVIARVRDALVGTLAQETWQRLHMRLRHAAGELTIHTGGAGPLRWLSARLSSLEQDGPAWLGQALPALLAQLLTPPVASNPFVRGAQHLCKWLFELLPLLFVGLCGYQLTVSFSQGQYLGAPFLLHAGALLLLLCLGLHGGVALVFPLAWPRRHRRFTHLLAEQLRRLLWQRYVSVLDDFAEAVRREQQRLDQLCGQLQTQQQQLALVEPTSVQGVFALPETWRQ